MTQYLTASSNFNS